MDTRLRRIPRRMHWSMPCARKRRRNCNTFIQDLFYDITLFSNRAVTATTHKGPDGKYQVTVETEAPSSKPMKKATRPKFRWMTGSKSERWPRRRRESALAKSCTVSACT